MLASDLDLRTAGHVLGHSQVAQAARYSYILKDRRSVAASRIEATLFAPKQRRRESRGRSAIETKTEARIASPSGGATNCWSGEPEVGFEPTT